MWRLVAAFIVGDLSTTLCQLRVAGLGHRPDSKMPVIFPLAISLIMTLEHLSILKKQKMFYLYVLELGKQQKELLLNHTPLSAIIPLIRQQEILFNCAQKIEVLFTSSGRISAGREESGDTVCDEGITEPIVQKEIRKLLQEVLTLAKTNQELFQSRFLTGEQP